MSEDHKDFLKHCWPLALKNSKLLSQSDIMVYMTPEQDRTNIHKSYTLLMDIFKRLILTVYLESNPGYAAGAVNALVDASEIVSLIAMVGSFE